mmetsp:Transcript_45209/g.112394  ORF Transcript_45209/g.112394 Transcript_45209/m.112394 type:complete len:215 (-) Transcript_45209:107-751(-)
MRRRVLLRRLGWRSVLVRLLADRTAVQEAFELNPTAHVASGDERARAIAGELNATLAQQLNDRHIVRQGPIRFAGRHSDSFHQLVVHLAVELLHHAVLRRRSLHRLHCRRLARRRVGRLLPPAAVCKRVVDGHVRVALFAAVEQRVHRSPRCRRGLLPRGSAGLRDAVHELTHLGPAAATAHVAAALVLPVLGRRGAAAYSKRVRHSERIRHSS